MFESKRLSFRNLTDKDADDFFEIFNSEKVSKFIPSMNFKQTKNYIKKSMQFPFLFAVILKETGKMIGIIGLKEKQPNIATLSYVFNDKFWHKGYASESVNIVVDKAFGSWNFNEIKADCQFNNLASNKLLKKFNFQFEYSNKENISHLTNEKIKFNFYSLKKPN